MLLRNIILHFAVALSFSSAVVFAQSVSDTLTSPPDSLQLRILGIDIAKAEVQVVQTDLLHRLMPKVTVSASYGVKDLFFVDPASAVPWVLPKDVYRLTVSFSLDEILNFAGHSSAQCELEKLRIAREESGRRLGLSRRLLMNDLAELDSLISIADEERSARESVFLFNELRFRQGRIDYEVFLRAKLDLLNARKTLLHLGRMRLGFREKLQAISAISVLPGIPIL